MLLYTKIRFVADDGVDEKHSSLVVQVVHHLFLTLFVFLLIMHLFFVVRDVHHRFLDLFGVFLVMHSSIVVHDVHHEFLLAVVALS